MKARRNQTRLDKSFMDINPKCLIKAKKLRYKEKSIVRMAENAVYMGMAEDDVSNPTIIENYFSKLRRAFQKDLHFYLNAEFVFVFSGDNLLDFISIPSSLRGETQQVWKSNQMNWRQMDKDEKDDMMKYQIRNFNYNAEQNMHSAIGKAKIPDSSYLNGVWNFGAGDSEYGQDEDERFRDY